VTVAGCLACAGIADDAIISVDETQRITLFNRGAERVFGYSAQEVIGQNVNVLMPEPYRHEHDGYMNRYLTTGEKRIIGIGREVTGRRKDGTGFPCALNIRRIQVGGKEYTVAVVRDLTPQRRAEEFFRVLFEKASDSIYLVEDQTQQVVEANEAACRMLGYTREEFLKLKIPDLVPPEFRHRIPGVRKHLAEAGGYQRDRRMLLRKDGTSVPTDQTITKLDLGGCLFFRNSSRV
jgi:two-component system sensor kinase FixL